MTNGRQFWGENFSTLQPRIFPFPHGSKHIKPSCGPSHFLGNTVLMRDGLEQWMQNPVITVSLSNKLARERYSFLSLSLFWPVYSVMLLVYCSSICCDCFSRDEDGAPGSLWMRHLETLGLFLPHSLKARLCPVCTYVHLRPILLRVDFSVTSVVRQVCKL